MPYLNTFVKQRDGSGRGESRPEPPNLLFLELHGGRAGWWENEVEKRETSLGEG
jgi:hypothetical protein